MLLEKYRPESTNEFLGNKEQLNAIRQWLRDWKKGTALLIAGPSGCGKSLSIEMIAKESGCELLKSHASDERGYREFENIIGASQQKSLLLRKKIILVDDLETMESSKGIAELIKSSKYPVVLIAENPYEINAAARKSCKTVMFSRIRHDTIANFLKYVCKNEGMARKDSDMEQLARACNGDVRAALIDLECGSAYRESEESVFNTLKVIFKASSIENVQAAISNSDKPIDELLLWLEENIAEEYSDAEEVATAYDCLSKADITSTRIIRRQSWTLQKYLNTAVHGIAMSKKSASRRFVSYKPPRFFSRKDGADEGISKLLHCSRKKAAGYKRLIEMLAVHG